MVWIEINEAAGIEPTTMNQCDVIIIGSGIVGGTLACALAETGLRVALIGKVWI